MTATTTTAAGGSAVLSACGTYRYVLRRRWAPGPGCVWIMLNPSTADATTDDPTIRRCVGFAGRWGYAAITVRNLFALRAPDPAALRAHPDPVGPDNDHWLTSPPTPEGLVVCAWGTHGQLADRARTVTRQLRGAGIALSCLGLTRAGQLRHPLYLPAALDPRPYPPDGGDHR